MLGDRTEPKSGALAQDERSALLGWSEGDDSEAIIPEASVEEMPPDSPDAAFGGSPFGAPDAHEDGVKGDPTQHLLTALGRFQRQVARAEHGAPDTVWADECMNQIIAGIEIALEQDWDGVREALTDTARVLHSYELADQAIKCVPFLQDSYEILCLMVGDLIVDNIRSGVLQKWRAHYQRAVDELLRAGIALAEDDDDDEDEAAPMPQEAAHASAPPSIEAPEAFAPANDDAPEEEDPFGLPGESNSADIALDIATPAHPIVSAESSSPVDDSPFALPEMFEAAAEPPIEAPSLDAHFERPEVEEAIESAETPAEDIAPPHASEPEAEAEAAVEEEETTLIQEEPETVLGQPLAEVMEEPAEEVLEDKAPVEAIAEEPPIDTAIADETADAAAAPTAQRTPRPVAPEQQDLFRSVQEAMSQGNVSDAKRMALQLAADIARMEVEQDLQNMSAAEQRLTEFAAAIEAAHAEVTRAEQHVAETEARTSQCEAEMQERRQRAGELRERAAAAQERISALEAQIRELEAQRDMAQADAAAVAVELDEALAQESRTQTDLEGLADMESAAQETAALARRNLEAMKNEREDLEAEAAMARKQLEQRRKSAEEIGRTLDRVAGGAAPVEETETDLLF